MKRTLVIAASGMLALAGLTVTGCQNRTYDDDRDGYGTMDRDVRDRDIRADEPFRDTARPAGDTDLGDIRNRNLQQGTGGQ